MMCTCGKLAQPIPTITKIRKCFLPFSVQFFKTAQAWDQTWDLLVFIYFISLKQSQRPLCTSILHFNASAKLYNTDSCCAEARFFLFRLLMINLLLLLLQNDILSLEIDNLNMVLTDHLLNRLFIPLYIFSLVRRSNTNSTEVKYMHRLS